ncbi:MAG TPA: hypothetical protein VGG85_15500 [Terracidiphilus sp.]
MNGKTTHQPAAEKTRIATFAHFFKSYMSVSTIVAASIPIPITNWRLIPIFSQQRGFLTVYASLFCFLLLAFVFSIRHRLAVPVFSRGRLGAFIAALPFIFILLTLACILAYHGVLQQSIGELRELGLRNTTSDLLDKVDASEIPHALALAASYLGIFLFAESAFVLMAVREYLQDLMHLDETALLFGNAHVVPPLAPVQTPLVPESAQRVADSGSPHRLA